MESTDRVGIMIVDGGTSKEKYGEGTAIVL
jgi:hypothetical protein